MSGMEFLPPMRCESQRPQIEAREVAARWARLPDGERHDRLWMLGADERRLVIDALREHGVQIGGHR